jgi:hypothetical protein
VAMEEALNGENMLGKIKQDLEKGGANYFNFLISFISSLAPNL